MDKPFPAYEGSNSYIFICYSHDDSGSVYDDLMKMHQDGINIWYDEGIPAGTAWRGEIAEAIKGASKLLFFISEKSLVSNHCLREVDYALNHDVEIIPVYLEVVDLPPELDLVLNRVQALYREKDPRYMERLMEAIRGRVGLSPRGARKGGRKNAILVPVLVVAIAVVAGFFWLYRDSQVTGNEISREAVAQADSFDLYLEGMKLMERWDKDDNLSRAIELFREATEQDGEFALAYARMGEALRMQYAISGEMNYLEQASTAVDQAVRINPRLAPVQVSQGKLYATQGEMDLAFAALERALEIDPNDASANAAIARLYERLGRMEDAEEMFEKSISLEPENLQNIDAFANFLYRRSRFEEAADLWRSEIRLAPDNYTALLNLGSALNETGQISEAVTMFERALQIQPTYLAYSNLGTAYGRAQRYGEAVEAFRKAIELNESDWQVWGNLGYIYSWMDDRDEEADEAFNQAISLAELDKEQNSRDPFVYSYLALYYAKTGNSELALQRIRTALSLSADSSEILANSSEAYEILGQRQKAQELLEEALSLGYPVQQIRRNPEFVSLLVETDI